MSRALCVGVFLLTSTAAAAPPDPAAVRRHGPAYRYPQAGWTVLHVEGAPYDRGFQHGKLLSSEIAEYTASLAAQQSKADPDSAWAITRTMVSALFLRKFDREQLDEMQGIADGAADGGAKYGDRSVDLLDVVCANVQMEYETLDNALDALPTGLEGVKFPKPAPKPAPVPAKDHCSAFAATGPATADGRLVIGHITMSGLANALGTNVWLDVKPAAGHRIVMQGFPGAIWSAQDYYINSAGIILTETTIRQTRFNPDGVPLAARCRRAMQYGSSIDDVVKILTEKNNGLYTNDWLIGDANTNEIASLELGTTTHKLHRSSKNEWLTPGTEGFYWGCNNTKDLKVRTDALPGLLGRPQDLSFVPSDRDKAWLKLFDRHRGRIDAGFGKLAFSTPPLAAHPSLDAKVTTAGMARRLESHALFGPPYGRVWVASEREKAKYRDVRSLVPNDWTVLTTAAPPAGDLVAAADLGPKLPEPPADPAAAPAWVGSLLPASDADVWLTAGAAAYERVAARPDAGRAALDRRWHEATYLAAVASRPDWRPEAVAAGAKSPTPLRLALDRDRWHREQTGYGVLALDALSKLLGKDKFAAAVDDFGRANAGKPVTVGAFAQSLHKATGADVAGFLDEFEPPAEEGRPVLVTGWQADPESAVIVYGTAADAVANKAAAELIQATFQDKWSNVVVPALADTAAGGAALKGKHVILVGRPAANAVTARFRAALPATFGPASAVVNGDTYAHDRTAVAAAGVNPADPRYSVAVLAGLSADATYHAAEGFVTGPAAEVVVFPQGKPGVPVLVGRKK